MAIDWESKVGAPCIGVFGEPSPATYIPYSGAPSFPVTGVFDSEFRASAVIDEGAKTTDFLPVLGVNSRQFPSPPVQNDMIVFPAGSQWYAGKAYLVKEPRPDGHGIFHLALNETTPP